jgi:hypothetical protein
MNICARIETPYFTSKLYRLKVRRYPDSDLILCV